MHCTFICFAIQGELTITDSSQSYDAVQLGLSSHSTVKHWLFVLCWQCHIRRCTLCCFVHSLVMFCLRTSSPIRKAVPLSGPIIRCWTLELGNHALTCLTSHNRVSPSIVPPSSRKAWPLYEGLYVHTSPSSTMEVSNPTGSHPIIQYSTSDINNPLKILNV